MKSDAKDGATGKTPAEVAELLYQQLETELGGVEIYRAAVRCAVHPKLKEEWRKYLEQTERHVRIMQDLCAAFGLDPEKDTPGRQVVRHLGRSLVKAMDLALGAGKPESAQIVAAECVVLAETKDHLDWELIGKLAEEGRLEHADKLREAHEQAEDEEDEHLYHTQGWLRELWTEALGMQAVLPPPEEVHDVRSQAAAARVKKARRDAGREAGEAGA
ncbi:MAG TPA: hypothetical protein VEI02_13520 [Planctomycetota bacterium]|nr:hypothetical protein [Planctomycetota bacterium]